MGLLQDDTARPNRHANHDRPPPLLLTSAMNIGTCRLRLRK
jgi:hypothetical protein